MATNVKQTLANQVAEVKSEIESKTVLYKSLTNSLIETVGDSGETIFTTIADVQVTQRTFDRQGDDLTVVFDKDVFMGLDRRTKTRLEALGLVKIERKMITGQAPKVVVRLK